MQRFKDAKENPLVDPVSWFNEFGSFISIFDGVKSVYIISDTQVNDDPEDIKKPSFEDSGSMVKVTGNNSYDLSHPMVITKFMLLTAVQFKGDYNSAMNYVKHYLMKLESDYMRVACDYFRTIKKPNRYGGSDLMIKAWKKDELKQDYDSWYLKMLPKFSDFTIVPDNKNYRKVIGDCFNLYAKFPHTEHKDSPISLNDIPATAMLMEHTFGEQSQFGYKYMKILYENPMQILPILVLISNERNTGKTTFLNWINMIFGENSILIYPGDLASQHNSVYATKNILLIDETLIEKTHAAEKLKSLSTAKTLTVDPKFVQQYSLPFFGKIIMSTNKEVDFMKIDSEEIRYWIRKVPIIPAENHNVKIEDDLFREIPKFLRYLSDMAAIDFTKSRMVFTKEDIITENLKEIKNESKSWLAKEIEMLVEDHFNNSDLDEFPATPIDIKKKWFIHNSRVDINYIRRVLKSELKMAPSEKAIRYRPINVEGGALTVTGYPYIFTRNGKKQTATDYKIQPIHQSQNSSIDFPPNNESPYQQLHL